MLQALGGAPCSMCVLLCVASSKYPGRNGCWAVVRRESAGGCGAFATAKLSAPAGKACVHDKSQVARVAQAARIS